MNRYQLATLVKWAETLETRKRLQKVVYLLQVGGCDLDVEYTLHHFGPYSHDVASLTDEMVQAVLLCEKETANPLAGSSFSYSLSESAESKLERLQKSPDHQRHLGTLDKHEQLAKRLLREDLKKLEFAATIAYFHAREPDRGWEHARERAAKFKAQEPDGTNMREAERLARKVVDAGSSN